MRQKQTPKSCISARYFVLRSSKARGNLERNVKRLSARRAHPSDRQSRCRQKRLVRQIIANVAHWTRVHSTASRHYRANIDFVPVHSQRCLGVGGELINQLYFQISQFFWFFWQDSPLVRAVREGRTLVVDEADKAPLEVVIILKGLVEDGEMLLSDGRRIVSDIHTFYTRI